MLRSLILAGTAAALAAADLHPDVAALDDPRRRAEAWARLVAASELHGLIDGSPTAVLRAGSGKAPLLVLLPPPPSPIIDTDQDIEEDLWPGLDLAHILPVSDRLLPSGGLGTRQLWRVTAAGGIAAMDQGYHNVLADLDGDGAAELAAVSNVRLTDERWACDLLIQRLDVTPPRRLVRLLCGADQRTWALALRQPALLEAGPLEHGLVVPAFTLRWDAQRRDWRCSDERWVQRLGPDDDEAAVLAAGARLPKAGPPSPPTLDERVAGALSRPYAAQRFAGRDVAGIIAWMGPGRTWEQLLQSSLETPQLPASCWSLPPAEAALVFARANRRRSGEAQWPLGAGRVAPRPQGDAILESWCRAHGRGDDCQHDLLLLHLAGADSFLAHTSQYCRIGLRTGMPVRSPSHTVTFQPVPEALARQALDVLRQLAALDGQVETTFDAHHHGYSSADAAGSLSIDGVPVAAGTTWCGSPGERWRGPLDDDARLNLARLWLHRALTARLGAGWPQGPLGDAEREDRDARIILERWRSGTIPGVMAGIAASLLANRGAADLPALLGDLPPDADARLLAALTRSRFRLTAADDQARLLTAARNDGPEQTWALEQLLERDQPAALAVLRGLVAAADDEHQRRTWNSWLAEAGAPPRPHQRIIPQAAVPTTPIARPWPTTPAPAAVPVSGVVEREALLDALREATVVNLRAALDAAVPRLCAGTAEDAVSLDAVLADRLADTRAPIRPLLLAIWAHDLRRLRPGLLAIATAGPDDQEGPRLVRSGGTRGVQRARYHLARQVLSLWDEADGTARARLLAAFALHQGIDPAADDAAGRRLAAGLVACGAWQAATRDVLAVWTGPVPGGLAGDR